MPDLLVTGARGSVGRRLVPYLRQMGWGVLAVDLEEMDVTDARQVEAVIGYERPETIFHLAGAKHAFEGELDPGRATEINVMGTRNVLAAAERVEARVIFSSTCKACDPETAYGASKLVAERLVLNAGGVVVRFYNIPESDGNVFRLWEALPLSEPIPYTDCWRYFISMQEALELTSAALELESGRYVHNPGLPLHMRNVAADLYPGRALVEVPRRRGDRQREPLKAECEDLWPIRGTSFCAVSSPYDIRDTSDYDQALAVAL